MLQPAVVRLMLCMRYSMTLCEPVGEGNFGVVYRAQLRQNDHCLTVAVKMLKGSNFHLVFHRTKYLLCDNDFSPTVIYLAIIDDNTR